MAYVAYEIKRSKETRRGMIYLVKCNRLGKYAITTWVGSTGSAMGSVECQGTVRLCPERMAKKLRKRTILSANWFNGMTNRVTPIDDNIYS